MKPHVVLIKKNSMKLYLFLKAKSQAQTYQHSCMCLHKRQDVKKNVKKKIGENWFALYFVWVSRIILVLGYGLLLFVVCFLLMLC